MNRSDFIPIKDCEGVNPEILKTCCDDFLFLANNYDKCICGKYGFNTGYEIYSNIFNENQEDCLYFKRDGRCCLENLM